MEIFNFFNRKQEVDEPFESFYADLRKLIKSCEFEDQEEKLLKTQIVLGINSKNVQERLLREDATLEKTVFFCKSVELSEKNMKIIAKNEEKEVFNLQRNKMEKTTKNFFQRKAI